MEMFFTVIGVVWVAYIITKALFWLDGQKW